MTANETSDARGHLPAWRNGRGRPFCSGTEWPCNPLFSFVFNDLQAKNVTHCEMCYVECAPASAAAGTLADSRKVQPGKRPVCHGKETYPQPLVARPAGWGDTMGIIATESQAF